MAKTMEKYAAPLVNDLAEVSKERLEWLVNNTLVGFTATRGNAWHYRAAQAGKKSNHYEGAIPVDDVRKRLFNWKAISAPLSVTIDNEAGFSEYLPVVGRQAIITSDTRQVLGIFKKGYSIHQPEEWLLENVARLLGNELVVGSAGQLKKRALAWVEVTVPETIKTPEDVEFRANLTACTSFDGSMATTYKRMVQLVCCDNSLRAGLSEDGQEVKFRHTASAQVRLDANREALALVFDTAEQFKAETARLCGHKVTPKQWEALVDFMVPMEQEGGGKRAKTLAETKRFELDDLWRNDPRVAPWKGKAFGALQAFNTWDHHMQPVKGSTIRAERNMRRALTGRTERNDRKVLEFLGANA